MSSIDLKEKTVLVTGIDGFVGRNLAPLLVSKEMDVWGLCRGVSTKPKMDGVKRIVGDIAEPNTWINALAQKPPDVVVHLAALSTSGGAANRSPATTVRINTLGVIAVMEACALINPEVVHVVASSTKVYAATSAPISEGVVKSTGLYQATKLAMEILAIEAARTLGRTVIARIGNIFGPGDEAYRLIPNVCREIKGGNTAKITDETVTWLYITDAVSGLLALIRYALDLEASKTSSIFNLCGSSDWRWGNHETEALFKSKTLPNTIGRTCPTSNSTLSTATGWVPVADILKAACETLGSYPETS